jgi:ankyrin repeat protein
MPPPNIPPELLLMIAGYIMDDHGEPRYGDFNSFLQVNRALYACLNRMLWEQAGKHEVGTQRVLTHLIKTNNLAGLEFFLELGADVEVRLPAFYVVGLEIGAAGPTPLLIAADLGNVSLARILLEKGAKVQYLGWYRGKFSPMHAARSAEMVQLLLDHDADPNLEDGIYRRPLHWYVIRHDIAAMRAILQHGAELEVNGIGPFEKPLHVGAQRNLDTVELLVEHGADVRERDFQENTPLHLAAAAGKIDVVKFLAERWPEGTRKTNERHSTPLHMAAMADKIDVVRFLVEQWPEGMRERDGSLNTPLHHAASCGWKTEVMGLLVEGWPEGVREKNQWGDTPLHLAAKRGKTDAVRLLMEHWPEGMMEKNITHGDTPLHSAAEEGKTEVVMLLAEAWPEGVREKNKHGNTPLHLAAHTGRIDVLRLLVQRWPEGKEVLIKDDKTPLSWFEAH